MLINILPLSGIEGESSNSVSFFLTVFDFLIQILDFNLMDIDVTALLQIVF